MQKIIPNLWYDQEARKAAGFYTSVFPNSRLTNLTTLHNTPSGNTDIVTFTVLGYTFMAITAGPVFTFNPAISFMVNFDPSRDKEAKKKIETIWAKLLEGGKVLMPIDTYPFSKRYGWIQDKYGLSWQLILTNPEGEERPPIIPFLLFVGDVYGQAEKASNFYLSVFKDTKRGALTLYPAGMEPDKPGAVMFTDFKLENQWFAAMDSAREHDFAFNEAISFIIQCAGQEEMDYYWDKLSAVPESEQCGWLKDKFGVSWQINPIAMDSMLKEGTREQIDRVTQAFLPMKRLDLAALQKAYQGG